MLVVFSKAYIHGHYRINAKTGKRTWVDSYTDKRPERHRTAFRDWGHRVEHFEEHLTRGKRRLALHAFHDLNHADSHKLARELGLHDGEDHATKQALMEAVHDRLKAKETELSDRKAAEVHADWERRKASGDVGKVRIQRAKPQDGATKTEHGITYTLIDGRWHRADLDSSAKRANIADDRGGTVHAPTAGDDPMSGQAQIFYPPLPAVLPDKETRLEWAPMGTASGIRMYADLSPKGAGHLLRYSVNVGRQYATGAPIGGTAARVAVNVVIGAIPGKGWVAELSGEPGTPKRTEKGDGSLADATRAAAKAVVEYARTQTRNLPSGQAVPVTITAPTGGTLLDLAKLSSPKPAESPAPAPEPRGLDNPETYANNPELATLARRLAEAEFRAQAPGTSKIGDLKRKYLNGERAAEVGAALDAKAAEEAEKAAKTTKAKGDAAAIVAPSGYNVSVDGDTITVTGPFEQSFHDAIKRADGRYDGYSKVWTIPAEKGSTLKRIMANLGKRVDEAKAQAAAAQAKANAPSTMDPEIGKAKVRELKRAEMLRWLGYVEDAAKEGRTYEKGISKLNDLGIGLAGHDDLYQRLLAAMNQAGAIQAQKQAAADAEIQHKGKTYLSVPFEKKDVAKRHGAKWDSDVKRWYVIGDVPDALQSFTAPAQPKLRVLFPMSTTPTLNQPVTLNDQPVVFTGFGQPFRIGEDDPSVHGSHLLGHEGERGRYAYYRPATEEEIATLNARREQKAARSSKINAATVLAGDFRKYGERPEGMRSVDGETLVDAGNAYGGGDWWVIQPDAIWYIQNNGSDGANWAWNNVRTGGAGAIGWKMPRTQEAERILRDADAAMKS